VRTIQGPRHDPGDLGLTNNHKIYVDAEQPATLNNGAGKLTDYATLQEAVMAWHRLRPEQTKRATIKVFVERTARAVQQYWRSSERSRRSPKLELTGQRSAVYQKVHKDKSKVAPSRVATDVGADVPPMIELYTLPDDILANNPETKLYKFTRVDDQVVLVDPVKMRVIAVIGPKTKDWGSMTLAGAISGLLGQFYTA
jgi:Protein of unknown function (DUF1236)